MGTKCMVRALWVQLVGKDLWAQLVDLWAQLVVPVASAPGIPVNLNSLP